MDISNAINMVKTNVNTKQIIANYNISDSEITKNIGKFLYVIQNENFTIIKHNIIQVVKKDSNANIPTSNYLTASSNYLKWLKELVKSNSMYEYQKNILNKLYVWVENPKTKFSGTVLIGDTFTGKKVIAGVLAVKLANSRKQVAVIAFNDLFEKATSKKDYNNDYHMFINSHLLIIEDLKLVSNYHVDILLDVLKNRLLKNQKTLILNNESLFKAVKNSSANEDLKKEFFEFFETFCVLDLNEEKKK